MQEGDMHLNLNTESGDTVEADLNSTRHYFHIVNTRALLHMEVAAYAHNHLKKLAKA